MISEGKRALLFLIKNEDLLGSMSFYIFLVREAHMSKCLRVMLSYQGTGVLATLKISEKFIPDLLPFNSLDVIGFFII